MIADTNYKNLEVLVYSFGCPERLDGLNEDAWKVGRRSLAVADGTTQLSYTREELTTKRSKALEVAELWCNAIVDAIDSKIASESPSSIISKCADFANSKIRGFNEAHDIKPDFWTIDYANCMGAAAFIDNKRLYYGFISDCFVAVLNKDNGWKLEAIDDYIPVHDFWVNLQGRETREYVTRALIRNKPGLYDKQGRQLGYGQFTGELDALKFLRTGEVQLTSGDILLLGTDGIMPYLEDRKFIEVLRGADKEIECYLENGNKKGRPWWKERTLIVGRVA